MDNKISNDATHDTLLDAAKKGDIEQVRTLLTHSTIISSWEMLYQALWNGHIEIAELLINHGPDYVWRQIIEHQAALKGDAQVQVIINSDLHDKVKKDIDVQIIVHSSLYDAVKRGDTEQVRTLLDHCAIISSWGIIYQALWNGHMEVAELLINHGANVNATNLWRKTILHQAVLKGDAQIVAFLIDHHADVNAMDGYGMTALHLAVEDEDDIDIAELLINHGANVNAKNEDGKTALDLAIKHGNKEVVKYLKKIMTSHKSQY